MTAVLKVVHLLDTDRFAGTERYVLTLARELMLSGACPYIACLHGSPLHREGEQQNLPMLPILSPRRPLATLRALVYALRSENVALMHAHNGRTTLLAALAQRATHVPVVMTQHFLAPQFTTYQGLKRVAANEAHRWVNRQLAHIIAISEATRASMMAREHISTDQITLIPNGIARVVEPEPARLAGLRQELGLAPAQPIVVTVARLVPEKGIHCLLQSIPSVLEAVPEACFVIVGEGPLRASLQSETCALGIAARTTFTGFRNDAQDLIAMGDVFALPSPAEPFGLVLLEAMALGKPVIATHAGGPLEIVEERRTGLFVPPEDADALARALSHLLLNPQLGREMGQAGRIRYEQHFTARQMAQATRAVYEKVVAGDG